jgi:hypothetical protein
LLLGGVESRVVMTHVLYVRIQLQHLQVLQQRYLSSLTVSRIIGLAHSLLFNDSGLGHSSSHAHGLSHSFVHCSGFHARIVVGNW